jgi:hypothetical protein
MDRPGGLSYVCKKIFRHRVNPVPPNRVLYIRELQRLFFSY